MWHRSPAAKLADTLARALDPVSLALDVGITPDAWQAALLREHPRRSLLLCSRQSGKSTVTALSALWQAVYEPGLIVIGSPSPRQSAESVRTVLLYHSKLAAAPPAPDEATLSAAFPNGSL